jgi:hypothetical protein
VRHWLGRVGYLLPRRDTPGEADPMAETAKPEAKT